jgi:tetratricopeptide (TPR) repeat protein
MEDDLQRRAQSMSDQNDWGEGALALYESILQADPKDEAAAVGRARCLRALGRLEESFAVLVTLMKERPDNPAARSQATKTKRHLDAKTRAEHLLAKDPKALFDALERAKQQERDHKFQVEGRRLLARRDRTIEAACALGAAQRRDRDLDGALNTYRWAVKQNGSPESNPMTHVGLSGVLRDLGRLADAEEILREVRAANRNDHFAGITLAAVLMDRAEHRGDRRGLGEARQLLGAAWAAGARDGVIKAAFGRLKSLE